MNKRTFTSGIHYVSPTDFLLEVDSSAGGVVLILPSIATYNEFQRRIGSLNQTFNYRFQDISKTAGTNNIIFQANPDDDVNNGVSVVISTDGANGTIVITGDNEWSLDAGSAGGGGGSGTLLFNATEDKQITPLNSTPTSIMPTVGIGSSIIPANFLTDGKKLSIRIGGTVSVDDIDSVAFGVNPLIVKFGGQNIILSKTSGGLGSPNKAFCIMLELTYRSAGNILVSTGLVSLTSSADVLVAPTPIVIDPTIDNAMDVLTAFGGVASGVVVTTTIMSIESPTLIS